MYAHKTMCSIEAKQVSRIRHHCCGYFSEKIYAHLDTVMMKNNCEKSSGFEKSILILVKLQSQVKSTIVYV